MNDDNNLDNNTILGFSISYLRSCGQIYWDFRRLERLYSKVAKVKSRIHFLLQCKYSGIFPNFITNRLDKLKDAVPITNIKYSQVFSMQLDRLKITMLSSEIGEAHLEEEYIYVSIGRLWSRIESNTNPHLYNSLQSFFEIYYERQYSRDIQRVKNKIKILKRFNLDDVRQNESNDDVENIISDVVNVSSLVLPQKVTKILSYGNKFSYVSSEVKSPNNRFLNLVCEMEKQLRNIQPEMERNQTRSRMNNLLNNYLHNFSPTIEDRRLSRDISYAKKYIHDNIEEIQVLLSDKSNITVVMNRHEYHCKVKQLLTNNDKFQVAGLTSLASLQKKVNKYLGQLLSLEIIDKKAYNNMKSSTPTPSKMYALVKAHKSEMPLRIIVSSVGSPINGLSKFFSRILKAITTNSNRIINSFDLISKIEMTKLTGNEVLVSFDVEDMFGSIEVNLALNILDSRWEDIKMYTHLDKDMFMEGLAMCLRENYFTYDSIIYTQVKGLPMGAILSPLIANVVMDDVFDRIIAPLNLPFYYIYVDDSVSAMKRELIPVTLELLNGYNSNIKFNAEVENNSQLPFLDTLLIKSGHEIITDLYTKPSKSNRMIKYNSYHPLAQKISIIYGEINRIWRISHSSFLQKNLNDFTIKCVQNGYPRELVENLRRRYYVKEWKKRKIQENPLRFMGSLTYVPILTDMIVRMFRVAGVMLAKRPVKPLLSLYRVPTVKDVYNENNVVYEIKCKDCDRTYIGETKRMLRTRVIEHDKSVVKGKLISALAIHAIDSNHEFDFNDVSILCRERDDFIRKMKESLHILRNRDKVVNFKVDTENNVRYYSDLISKLIS